MDFREEDFPVYQLIISETTGLPRGAATARQVFERAETGGDEEKFEFAAEIQTLAAIPDCLPGQTAEMNKKTLQSCRAVFEDLASRGHARATIMLDYFNARGFGIPDDDAPAPKTPPQKPGPSKPKPGNFKFK